MTVRLDQGTREEPVQTRSIVCGVVGPCKTESSQKPVPVHPLIESKPLLNGRNSSLPQTGRLGLCKQTLPWPQAVLGTGDFAEVYSPKGARIRYSKTLRMAHLPPHVLDSPEKRRDGVQGDAGVACGIPHCDPPWTSTPRRSLRRSMRLRRLSCRSFSLQMEVSIPSRDGTRMGNLTWTDWGGQHTREIGHKRGTNLCPFAPSLVSAIRS